MKATAVKNILGKISEDIMDVNERRAKENAPAISYQVTIATSNREYELDLDENTNWSIDDGILWTEGDEGTRWIDCDKIESITL